MDKSVRVRFAPSPTGYLHIGGARTALYNYLYAKATNGTFVLRIEDTDEERSKREYEELQIADLKWLGMSYDEGPNKPGNYGPYRQSERKEIYLKKAQELVEKKLAFVCFCSEAELEEKKEKALRENLDPRYDGKCRHLTKEEIKRRTENGERGAIRFRAYEKSYVLKDHVRGDVTFPDGMVGDFIIIRSDGGAVYNFCCVVDDLMMKITHVIRGEDHLSNTLRQLMIYEAFDSTPPEFAHVSLLVGADRQKLSKRHGATSVHYYKEASYLPEAICNYLCLLGWSHPTEKDVFTMEEIGKLFDINRFSKSPAVFDIEKFRWMNGEHLRHLPIEDLKQRINESKVISDSSEYFKQDESWKNNFLTLFKEKIQFFPEINVHIDELFSSKVEITDELKEILSWETTPKIITYLKEDISKKISDKKIFVTEAEFNEWGEHIKKNLGIKGKPLFMGMRGVLTGKGHGSELKHLIPLTPLNIIKTRIDSL